MTHSLPLPSILILQIVAHILSDFYLQGQKMAEAKAHKGIRTPWLYLHILITFTLSWMCSGQVEFWKYAAMIAAIHFLVDALKVRFRRQRYWFFIDQFLHLATILLVIYGFNLPSTLPAPSGSGVSAFLNSDWIPYLLGYSLVLKPANFAIRELLLANQIHLPESHSGLENAGRLIGSVERLLAITLIFLNQYGALGFIIAAKSILRFKEAEPEKQEYVLIGSLLSFSVALFTALGVRAIV